MDPEVDEFAATERFREMTLPPGEMFMDIFARYLEEGTMARLDPKQVCRFLITQLPSGSTTKAKRMLSQQSADLGEDGALKMATEIPLARAQVAKQEETPDTMMHEGYRLLVNPELPEVERKQLEELAKQFEHLFAQDHKKPSRTTSVAQHAIITGDAQPQKSRPRRVPPKWEEEINKQLTEMLVTEPPIIRPSSSPWASDVVLVKKKDGAFVSQWSIAG